MAAVRFPLAQVVLCGGACLLAAEPTMRAQESRVSPSASVRDTVSCPQLADFRDDRSSDPQVSIAEITFSGELQLPISEQDEISQTIQQNVRATSPDGAIQDALERTRRGWQNRGYFEVKVSGDDKVLSSGPAVQRIALVIYVNEGLPYRLGGITFRGHKPIQDAKALRRLFPIRDGDVFAAEKISTGLENLRKAYGELGYINFTPLPDTKMDQGKELIDLVIDMDEGRRYFVDKVSVQGLDEVSRGEILKSFPLRHGQVYNSRLTEEFLVKYSEISLYARRKLDDRAGAVDIVFEQRSCGID